MKTQSTSLASHIYSRAITLPGMAAKPAVSSALAGIVLSSVTLLSHAADSVAGKESTQPAFSMKIVTHGEDSNRSDNLSEAGRQDNRRADVSIQTQVPQGMKTVSRVEKEQVRVKVSDGYRRSIRLDDGGVIWVSKDPASLTPLLNVTTSERVEMENGHFKNPVSFKVQTNYAWFVDSWELQVFKAEDSDFKKPLVNFMGRNLSNGQTVTWDGKTSGNQTIKAGDELRFVLSVKDKKGNRDETHPARLVLTGPERNIIDAQQNETARSFENNLARQTIPVQGSRVRIFGRDIAEGNQVVINDEKIDLVENRFVIEKLLPDGEHRFDVAITDNRKQTYHKPLDVKLENKYLFMVGLADLTVGEGKVSGNLETLSDGDKHLDGDVFVDGRLAFYLKGKIKGKYLVTAQMDTGTADIEELFDDIHKKDPTSLFRRLDPDKYYPVYGDDSTLIDDTNSQGKLYFRLDWDKSSALWGNFNTDFSGTELGAFNRSLYGAKLNHKSTQTTKDGEHKTDLTVFGSEAQTAFRHNQFLGTGGSLYYLKDTDIVDGSEKVWVEIRQRGSERAVDKVVLEEGRDYEIDDFQGRLILHRPLLQIAQQSGPSLIKDTPLDGNQVYLMVDYEYVPDNFTSDKASYGARGKVWLNDHIAVGATFAHENRSQDDYDLKAVDITLQKARGTYVRAEYAESEAVQTQGSFLSEDGGLNFEAFNGNSSGSDVSGSAFSIEARANLSEFIQNDGSIGAWYKLREAGFSTSRLDNGEETVDAGAEAIIQLSDAINLSARATVLDKKETVKTTTASVQGDYKVNNRLTLSSEVRHVREEDHTPGEKADGEGTLAAFKVGYDVNANVNVYAIAQATIDTKGTYADNNLYTIGTKTRLGSKLDLNGELSSGDRGDSATLGIDYRMTDSYSLYTNYILSSDSTAKARNTVTLGQRKTVSDQLRVYTEHQYTHENTQSGLGHTFGVDYQFSKELTANASVQSARLDKTDGGLTDRDAFSLGLNYRRERTDAFTRLEYRRDKGASEETEQWVTTNRANYRLSPSLRLQGKFNYSRTEDQLGDLRNAEFTEAGLGFAYRPIQHDRLNVLGRLTYLYDLQPLSQSVSPDEKALVASLEASYQLNQRWELGGKLAHKQGEIREDREQGNWQKNDASLAAIRARYHLTQNWDAMAEYHWLNSDESGDTQHGAMIAVDRHIGNNMKIGLGYNFTDFTDDLTDTDGTAKGWFVNLVGKF